MKGILNGKIIKIEEITDKVLAVELEVYEKKYSKETRKKEWTKVVYLVKAFNYIKNKISKDYKPGDYIDLAVDIEPKKHEEKFYYDVFAEGIVVSFDRSVNV